MKRFKFPLQPVITIRGWREQQMREAYGAAVRQLGEADAAVQQARAQLEKTETILRSGREVAFRAAEQAAFLEAYQQQRVNVEQLQKARDDAQRAADQAREIWQRARADLRAVGQLEQRARQQHRLANERDEQLALDEIASMRATRTATRQPA